MRFEDWDVILFPIGRDSKIPFKEFKVACTVVPDLELSHIHGLAGMPVMTCFVPSFAAGTPFQISIHSWRVPEISQYTRAYSKHPELVKFEARILVDGRLVSSTTFGRTVDGPHLITNTFEFTKTGELERLRFPHFRRELMYQNHWDAGDDVGRIKVIISEGFPRDSLSVPIERVKNIVAFSFQHAPLELLENSGIAWPCPSMWRCHPHNVTMPVPTYHPPASGHSHTHSPRRKYTLRENKPQSLQTPFGIGSVFQPQPPTNFMGGQPLPVPFFPRGAVAPGSSLSFPNSIHGSTAPATPTAYLDWYNSFSEGMNSDYAKTVWQNSRSSVKQSSDTSMPDYSSDQMHCSEAMHVSGSSLEDDPMSLKVPTNTPTTGQPEETFTMPSTYGMPPDLATSLTHSLLNQPLPLTVQPQGIPLPSSEVKSRKENRHLNVGESRASSASSTPLATHHEIRKFSQPIFGLGNNSGAEFSLPMSATSASDIGHHSRAPSPQVVYQTNPSRNSSKGEFGSNLTNLSTVHGSSCSPLPETHLAVGEPVSGANSPTTLSNMGNLLASTAVRRARNFTPVSAKVIDEEDEPRRLSQHMRLPEYGEGINDNA